MKKNDFLTDNIKDLTIAGIAAIGAVGASVIAIGGLAAKKISDHVIRDSDGFNKMGYDRKGYDREGYNKRGYNSDGYDRRGYNREGYNRAGFDRDGYNKEGYDIDGFDRQGFDKDGYDRQGYDQDGFNAQGFDRTKRNRSGKKASDIKRTIKKAEKHSQKVKKELEKKSFSYSLVECRQGMELLTREIISHYLGESFLSSDLCKNINTCVHHNLISEEDAAKLHQARIHCNDGVHANGAKTYNQVYFVNKMLEWLIETTYSIIENEPQ